MAVVLEGGCRVTGIKDGEPTINGTLSVWPQIGRANGASAISLRTMEFAPGLSPGFRNQECDQVIYVLEGAGTILIDGWPYEVQPETGVYLRPGAILMVDNPGPEPFVLISSQCPEPVTTSETLPSFTSPQSPETSSLHRPPIVPLADRKAVPTADRWYRVLVDDEVGSTQVTQFVGSIPPGRGPIIFTITKRCSSSCVASAVCGPGRLILPLPLDLASTYPKVRFTALKIRAMMSCDCWVFSIRREARV